ncbi:DUF58 domain-containing protein [Marinicellulosiphila megalodicopiae]|uniref:DUF58 domain-containing protein n=1 Tax=Marinicellulosiphila megalodicopiae TaxID=2724896 RepID=UPI003BB0F379
MNGFIKKRFEKIIKKRAQYSSHVTLSHKKIYIIPSKLSLMFLSVISLMVLAGINYENNVFYILAFWLLSLFVWNFILTFLNLAKLQIIAVNSTNCFVNESAEFQFQLLHPKKNIYGLMIHTPSQVLSLVHLNKNQAKSMFVKQPTFQRGQLPLDRMMFSSVYPFGIAYGFSYVFLELNTWVYPAAINANVLGGNNQNGDQETFEDTQIVGSEDFNQLKQYQPGERLGHIHWVNYAKTGELKVKEFVDVNAGNIWIAWDDFPMLEQESRLSHLCYLIIQADKNNIHYGLVLPGVKIEPVFQSELRQAHLNDCLLQLAKF